MKRKRYRECGLHNKEIDKLPISRHKKYLNNSSFGTAFLIEILYHRTTTWKEVMAMDKILKFIENHLEEPITNAELAKMAGYSESYFLHMFKEKMNESVQSYICRRRLIHTCEDILLGTRLIDVALKYNFMSHSAFSKAFRREFGVSPSLLKFAKYEIKCIGGSAMDKIFIKNLPVGTNKELLYEQLKKSIAEQELDVDENELQKVYELSCKAYQGKKRYSGEEYVTHPISVAIILCEIEAEPEMVLAGLLCDVKEKGDYDSISDKLPKKVKCFVDLIETDCQNEKVQLIKLAERLHNMRTVEYMDESIIKKKSKETLEFYIPIARSIGNRKLIDELNDLSLKYC